MGLCSEALIYLLGAWCEAAWGHKKPLLLDANPGSNPVPK